MNFQNKTTTTLIAIALATTAGNAFSQSNDGAEIKVGETSVVPSVRLDYVTIDNSFRTENDLVESNRFIVQPSVRWTADRRLLELGAEYNGRFAGSSDTVPGFTDHQLNFTTFAELSKRNSLSAALKIERQHYDVGTQVLADATPTDGLDVAVYQNIELAGRHTFGAFNAKGNIITGARLQRLVYNNREAFTQGLDFSRADGFSEFGYRISSDTRALAGFQISALDFQDDVRDRVDLSPYVGLAFSATGKLSGELRAGITQHQFDDTRVSSETDVFLRAQMSYAPSSLSLIKLGLLRELDNTNANVTAGETSPIKTSIDIDWEILWRTRIKTIASLNFENVEADCPNADFRTFGPSIEVEYSVRRWLSLGLSGATESRTASNCSSDPAFVPLQDYDHTRIGVFLKATI